jgi:hypothetical protein
MSIDVLLWIVVLLATFFLRALTLNSKRALVFACVCLVKTSWLEFPQLRFA